jgi:hypothetical protein
MKNKAFRGQFSLAILIILFLSLKTYAADQGILWPTEAGKRISSNFCEPRSMRFHTGIDVSTWGRQGYDLYSPVDGWICRVAASWWGYGKQLMICGEDDRKYLFAHMLDFDPDVEDYLLAEQRSSDDYSVNLFPDRNRFQVKRGQKIGRSGASGSGPPHIHFEIREMDDTTLNPLAYGIEIADSRSPGFKQLAIKPASAETLINGSPFPHISDMIWSNDESIYRIDEELRINGPVRLSLLCEDKANGAEYRLAPQKITVISSSDTIYHSNYERVEFSQNNLSGVIFDRELQNEFEQPWRCLWHENQYLSFLNHKEADSGILGTIGIPVGSDSIDVRIILEDASGNCSSAQFFLLHSAAEIPGSKICDQLKIDSASAHKMSPSNDFRIRWHANGATIGFRSNLELDSLVLVGSKVALVGLLKNAKNNYSCQLNANLLNNHELIIFARDVNGEIVLYEEIRGVYHNSGESAEYRIEDIASITLNEESFREEQFLQLEIADSSFTCFSLGPPGLTFLKRCKLEFNVSQIPADVREKLGVYRLKDEEWSYLNSTLNDTLLSAHSNQAGLFAVFADSIPPVLESQWPDKKMKSSKPVLIWNCLDELSGPKKARLWIDDKVFYPRYDPDTFRILFKVIEELTPGTHKVQLEVFDEFENRTELLGRVKN